MLGTHKTLHSTEWAGAHSASELDVSGKMNISDIFWITVDFLSLKYPNKKVTDKENQRLAKQSVEASDEGKKINKLKEALDEVKQLRHKSNPEPDGTGQPMQPARKSENHMNH